MSGYEDNDLGALDRLEDLLEAYCEARLAPSGAVLARIRANIVTQAAAAAATTAAASRLQLVEPAPKRTHWWSTSPVLRRAFALGFAATLTLGTTAAVMAAPPGSPFYNARVYLEALALPTQADARLEAHERHLDERLAEAETAAAAGDFNALTAALAAYQAEVDAATGDVGDDASRLAHLEAMLAKHTAMLTALAARLPEQSSIEHAIDMSSNAIDKLKARGNHAHPTHTPPGGPGGGDGGGSEDQGQQ